VRQPVPFGKYVLLERISVGGMAEVFKAKAFGVEGFEKILAIKRILPSMAEDADFIEMFIDEAKICGQLNHANICQVFELGRVNDSHFIAMEFVWGKDLLQMQNRFRKMRQTMKPEMAAFIAAKLCEGLDYAHKKKDATGKPLGIIHRDISPQNLLVSYEGELKIIDFGIAKAASRSSKTQAGVLKGKFGYMSPEQVRGLPLDRRSDIFAIGTILYEMLTADRVFIGDSDFETLEKVRNVDVPPPSKVNPKCPPALENIILKALKKEVEDRYQWAAEMQEDLQAFLMQQDPVFTAKHLSMWMREQFAAEMKREQDILDEQRKVSKDVLNQPPPSMDLGRPAQQPLPAMPLPGVAPPPAPPLMSVSGSTSSAATDLPSNSTKILDDLDLEAMEVKDLAGERTMITPGGSGGGNGVVPLPNQSTQILGANHPLPGMTAAAGGRPSPAPAGDLPSQSTVILDSGVVPIVPPSGPLRTTSEAKTMLEAQAPVIVPPRMTQQQSHSSPVIVSSQLAHPQTPPHGVMAGHLTPGTGRVVAPLPYAPARSTLWKDILIGVGVAAALVGGVLGARAFLGKSSAKGTLVVMVSPAAAADVLVDGTMRGHIEANVPLTLKDLPAGSHAVVVKSPSGWFSQTVALAANDVSVVTAALKSEAQAPAPSAPAPQIAPPQAPTPAAGTGKLRLNITSEGASVYVDGAQLPDEAWKIAIPLRADVPHEIRVTKPQREEVKLSITLKPGEEVSRDVDLMPAYGKVKVSSQPDGAEVYFNGHKMGLTPTVVGELDPGKPARLTLKHKGFAAITKYVSFDKGLEQDLSVTLVASKDDGMSGGDSGEEKAAKDSSHEHAPKAAADTSTPKPKKDGEGEAKTEPKHADVPKPAAAPSGESGYLIANTMPWAKVVIDGKDTGKTTPIAPRSKIALKPGKHVITFVANGKKFNFDVVIKAGEDTRLIKQLTDSGM